MFSSFKPQKVQYLRDELAKKKPKLEGEVFQVTNKYDGWYVYVCYDPTERKWLAPKSSAGREIPSLAWMAEHLTDKIFCPNIPIVLEAEAWQDMPFAELNGLLNRSKGDCSFKDVILKCHNIFLPEQPLMTALKRYECMNSLLKTRDSTKSKHIDIIGTLYIGEYDETRINTLRDEVISNNGEGIILRNIKAPYNSGKRNANILKDKLECEIDTKIIAIEESRGEKGNPSFTLVSERKNGIKIRTVMSKHSDIALYLINPMNFIGKIAKIKAMSEYEDGQLRQPVFVCVREDKNADDYD